MRTRQPLVARIIIAFVLMTLVISGVFSTSIVLIVHDIEEQLVSDELSHELDTILGNLHGSTLPPLAPYNRFYSSVMAKYPIPKQFSGIADGFTEVVDDEGAYYAFQRTIDGERYLLIQEQQEFEERENKLFEGVLAGFLLSLVAAGAIGWLVARQVIAPVVRLAHQVRHRDQLLPIAPPLAAEYADDEVGHLAAAFDNTLGQLRQSLEREHLFTSDVSHELRTPLMIIASSCELLRESSKLSVAQAEQIARIGRATDQMRELVQTFLMLARAKPEESGMGGTMTLGAAATEQYERWSADFLDKGLEFRLEITANDDGLYNATFLSTVISNLLRNALHYTESGSVRLILDGGSLRVEDTGIGIPPDQQAQVFQPFVRGRSAPGEGLGLGLSLVKRICEHQGWQVRLTPCLPTGSVFEIRLRP